MTTRRKTISATAKSGVNYVRTIVESHNCIFHDIDLNNDIGNDAHLEFIENEEATGCLIASQIKSGRSYFRNRADYATVQSDRDHFEYWNSHSLPISMIVYDPVNQRAFWCDITEFLRNHPERITDGPYTIRVPFSQPFNEHTFSAFYHHFAMYREIYKQDSYLGRALRDFANLENAEACLDGLFSLFSYHRHRIVSWYYMVSCFSNFAGHQVLRDLIIALCHVPGHPDIFWHKRNVIDHATRIKAQKLLTSYLDIDDVVLLLSEVDENGIERGTIGQCIHAIIDIVHDRDLMLERIVFDKHTSEHVRYWSLILLAYYKQESGLDIVGILRRYTMSFPDDEHICIIENIIDSARLFGGFTLY